MNKRFLLTAAIFSLATSAVTGFAGTATAQEMGSLAYYNITREEYQANEAEWKNFLEYQLNREPCQNYRAPPAGFYMKGCNIYRVEQPVAYVAPTPLVTQTETTTVVQETPRLLPIVSSYTIYFDFDKSGIRSDEQDTLEQIVQEITKYNPTQVTVAGHTDTSGSDKYNTKLSEKRAQAVALALTSYGIKNEVIDKKAFGEYDQAVPTGDGVKLEENRRVVVDFRRQD